MYPRFIQRRVREALEDTRVVMICGARQSGKITLAKQISDRKIPFFTLDDLVTFKTATTDPVSFMRELNRAIIDEVQRIPELISAIKVAVDKSSALKSRPQPLYPKGISQVCAASQPIVVTDLL